MQQGEVRTSRSRKEEQRRKKELQQRRRRRARRRLVKRVCFWILCCFLLVLLVDKAGELWELIQEIAEKRQLQAELEQRSESETFPKSLLELLEKNPEAREFVLNYAENKDKEWNRDVSQEVAEGEIPLFLQWDERWGYETYGDDFMAVTGCGPTCLSMVVCGLTGDTKWNPYEVAKWAEEQGYYVEGSGSAWDLMVSGAEHFGLVSEEVIFDEIHILAALESGMPIVCAMRPGDFTTGGHFLVLTGVDENGEILLNDPNSPEKSGKSWKLEELMPQIKNLWALSD